MRLFCDHCGWEFSPKALRQDSRYCSRCGKGLSDFVKEHLYDKGFRGDDEDRKRKPGHVNEDGADDEDDEDEGRRRRRRMEADNHDDTLSADENHDNDGPEVSASNIMILISIGSWKGETNQENNSTLYR